MSRSSLIRSSSPLDPNPEVLRFRVTDADHDVDLATVRVTNTSIAEHPWGYGFYAADQWDPAGDYGWLVAELPLLEGANALEVCATDAHGQECWSAAVTREAPEEKGATH